MKARDVFAALFGAIGIGRSLFSALALVAFLGIGAPAAMAEPAAVTTDPVTTISLTTATVSGEVTPDTEAAETYWFSQYAPLGTDHGESGEENWSSGPDSFAVVPPGGEVADHLSGLSAETEYEVRIGAVAFEGANAFVNQYSSIRAFTTDPATPPSLALDPPGTISYTTAQLSGTVNPEGGNTDAVAGLLPIGWEFEYAPTSQPDNWQVATGSPGFENPLTGSNAEGSPLVPVEAEASGLQPGTEYAYRLRARYAGLTTATPEAGYGHFTTGVVPPPTVTGLSADETLFSGFVNPNAPGPAPQDPAFETHWEFTCSPGCNFAGPSSGTLPGGESAVKVTAEPANLTPNQTYDVTLHATNAGGEESDTVVGAFTTSALKADVALATLTEPTQTSIQLNGAVNPHNDPLTDCHFVYGSGGSLDHSAPCEGMLPSGEGFEGVSTRISGLTPGTEYSFRLIAANSTGSTESDLRTFTTLEEESSGTCPNEAIRIQQHATNLPDCRAWERVSPQDKNNSDIVGVGQTTVASTSGDAVSFASVTPFGDAVGSAVVGQTAYVARRGSGGWATHAVTPASRPDALQTLVSSTKTEIFSDDLSTALTWGYDLPGSTDDEPNREDLYVEDTATRSLRAVNTSQAEPRSFFFDMGDPEVWGVSADAKHVSFVNRFQMLPKGVAPGYPNNMPNVYTWNDGTLELAGILPDGSVPFGGSTVGFGGEGSNLRGAMSVDGSRQIFLSPSSSESSPQQLYLRIDGTRTAWISEPENSAFSGEPQNVYFQGMTPDGRSVFFITDSALLKRDKTPGPDLYRWTDTPNPSAEDNLTLISESGMVLHHVTSGDALVGTSEDGTRIYYQDGNGRLAVWDDGVTRLISTAFVRSAAPKKQLTVTAAQPGYGRVSESGEWFAFLAKPGVDEPPTSNVYLYSLQNNTLACVACEAGSIAPSVTSRVPSAGILEYTAIRPRFLSDDGRIFFNTSRALVPQDTNGVDDAYEYNGKTGRLRLLSSGRGNAPSGFADASVSGNNVFLMTREPLIAGDSDSLVDIYDARAGGGFDEPEAFPQPPCEGEVCQGAGSSTSGAAMVGSQRTSRGNVVPRRHRCAAHKRHARHRCKKKSGRRHHKRPAHSNRRVSK